MLPKFSSRAFLAPMAGVSDPALRLQCKNLGAGLVVTEFTNIHSIIAKEKQLKENQKTIKEFIEYSEGERPLSVQLFGSDLNALEKAAKIVEPFFDLIDYNMGCPAPHVTKQMAGGALLQEKIVATASDQMIVITDASKEVEHLGAFPLPIGARFQRLFRHRKGV